MCIIDTYILRGATAKICCVPTPAGGGRPLCKNVAQSRILGNRAPKNIDRKDPVKDPVKDSLQSAPQEH